MRKLIYYINILHFVIYDKIKKSNIFLLGIPDVTSGRIILLLSLLPAMQIFIFYLMYCKVKDEKFQPEIVFLFVIPFGLLVWFSVIQKDKYLTYFKKFEKEPTAVKRKWARISFGVLVGIILLLIISIWIMIEVIH